MGHRYLLLFQQRLSAMSQRGRVLYLLQQDTAPMHRVYQTINLLAQNLVTFTDLQNSFNADLAVSLY